MEGRSARSSERGESSQQRRRLIRLHNACQVTYAPTESTRRELLTQGMARVRVLGRGVDMALFTPVRRPSPC
ncbi:MAG TPA: hypothetical protein VIJ28_00385 [Chloroflexota bacterium]|jgi:hypothetical protein